MTDEEITFDLLRGVDKDRALELLRHFSSECSKKDFETIGEELEYVDDRLELFGWSCHDLGYRFPPT